jgi:MEMO1 family protein
MNKLKDKTLRPPVVQGIFYPSDSDELQELIASYIKGKEKGTAPLIVTPHAGYNTAGQLMADAFIAAAGRKVKEVVIISPVHREEQEKIILPSFKKFSTAAGNLEINMKSLHLFKGEEPLIIRDDIPHLEEHAIEDQLPFISTIFPEVTILPVLLGKTTITMVKKLTKALERAYGDHLDDVLFVITSNLSTYEKEEAALAKADRALNLFQKGDWREICEEKRQGQIDACGAGALASILALYSKALTMNVISRSKSEGKESEKGKIVSYGAIAFEAGR